MIWEHWETGGGTNWCNALRTGKKKAQTGKELECVGKHVARPSEALKSVTHAGVTSGPAKLGALADKSGSMEPLERNETGQAIWEHWETNGGASSWKSKDSNSWS